VGIVVRSIATAYAFYRDTLSLPVHKEDIIQDQGVKAALLTIGQRNRIARTHHARHRCGTLSGKPWRGAPSFCFETDDVHRELEAAKTRGIAVIDQHPRQGLAGLICFLHPKASHGVLIEYAQP
jgi:methylmalonyl-CoA/ethylmalonyl-CoA epimerase